MGKRLIPYEPALDGIRALAVIAVLVYHNGGGGAPGGFLGVDAFFVLSGFLITTLLVEEFHRGGRIDIVAFWVRRARRLLPAIALALLLVAAYAAFVAQPSELRSIRIDSFYALFYAENWRQMLADHSYFDLSGAPSPLRHFWSLAIEEQWYLFWPAAAYGLLRMTRGRVERVLPVVLGLAVLSGSAATLLYRTDADASRVYYGTDTRSQALLIGAALALVMSWRGAAHAPRSRAAVEVGGLLGAAVMVWLVTQLTDSSTFLYRGGFTLAAIASALVITASVQPHGRFLHRWLAVKPLRALGRISYGVYLYHWPIFLWLSPSRTGWHDWSLFGLRFGVTVVVALISFVFVEMPIRHGSRVLTGRRVRVLVPAIAVVLIASLVVATSEAQRPAVASARAKLDHPVSVYPAGGTVPRLTQPSTPSKAAPPLKVALPVRVLASGDSIAWSLTDTDVDAVRKLGIEPLTNSLPACGIAGGRADRRARFGGGTCDTWAQEYAAHVDIAQPDVSLLMTGYFEALDHDTGHVTLKVGSDAYRALLFERLDQARRVLTHTGGRLIIALAPCFNVPYFTDDADAKQSDDIRRINWVDTVFADYARRHAIPVIDWRELLCDHGEVRYEIGGVKMRPDGEHFSHEGAIVAWNWLAPQIISALQKP